jgi:hypothetical protein
MRTSNPSSSWLYPGCLNRRPARTVRLPRETKRSTGFAWHSPLLVGVIRRTRSRAHQPARDVDRTARGSNLHPKTRRINGRRRQADASGSETTQAGDDKLCVPWLKLVMVQAARERQVGMAVNRQGSAWSRHIGRTHPTDGREACEKSAMAGLSPLPTSPAPSRLPQEWTKGCKSAGNTATGEIRGSVANDTPLKIRP